MEILASDNTLAKPMSRNYDFSQLMRPLRHCERAYTARQRDGRIEVFLVQEDDKPWVDCRVYVASDTYDAREACAELGAMIEAARLLVGGARAS